MACDKRINSTFYTILRSNDLLLMRQFFDQEGLINVCAFQYRVQCHRLDESQCCVCSVIRFTSKMIIDAIFMFICSL